jgi:hypothetical protein
VTTTSPDIARTVALPRRDQDAEAPAAEAAMAHLHTPGGAWRLRPHQALALHEAATVRGGLFPMGVGAGKTLLAHTLGQAMGIAPERTLCLVPGALVGEYKRQRRVLAQHFHVAAPHVVSYEKVGHPSGAKLLAELAPQLIIADEAHMLANKDSARTARFLRYAEEARARDGVAFVAMSASLLRRSLHDFAHLAKLALGDGSPLPHNYNLVDILDRALAEPGKAAPLLGYEWTYLARYEPQRGTMGPEAQQAWASVVAGDGARLRGPQVDALRLWARGVFRRRLLETPGVVSTEEPSCDVPIVGAVWPHAEVPGEWAKAAEAAVATMLLPCGQEIESQLAAYAAQHQLRLGYYLRWAGLGDDTLTPREWAYARREWGQALRSLVSMRRADLDSPALAEEAIRRLVDEEPPARKYTAAETRELRAAAAAWQAWEAVRHVYDGTREVVWLPGAHAHWQRMFATFDRWAHANGPTLVWAADTALYELAQQICPANLARPGEHPGAPDERVRWRLVSVDSHGTGLNLPQWQHNLLLAPPQDASALEQLVGRTHRPGQQHSMVGLWTMPGDGQLSAQTAQAEAIFLMTGQKQRLTSVRW